MTTPSLSIIIPHYGEPGPTYALLADLDTQIEAPPFEVIVVDDHSPTPLVVSGAKTVRSPRNSGFGSSVNRGAALATGEDLLIINSDVRLSNDFLRDLWRGYSTLSESIVTCSVVLENGAEQPLGKRQPRAFDRVLLGFQGFHRIRGTKFFRMLIGEEQSAWAWRRSTESVSYRVLPAFSGVVMCLPRSLFQSLQGFDERFFMYYEEMDLQRRASLLGISMVQLEKPVVKHSLGARNEAAWEWMRESSFLYYRLWGGARRSRSYSEIVLGMNGVWDLLRLVRNGGSSPWHSYLTNRQKMLDSWRRSEERLSMQSHD